LVSTKITGLLLALSALIVGASREIEWLKRHARGGDDERQN
jgi:hypothetical protein